MTGIFIRIKRDGEMKTIEIEHLTKQERLDHLSTTTHAEKMRWIDALCEVAVQKEENLIGLKAVLDVLDKAILEDDLVYGRELIEQAKSYTHYL